jgi:hypothetical protein
LDLRFLGDDDALAQQQQYRVKTDDLHLHSSDTNESMGVQHQANYRTYIDGTNAHHPSEKQGAWLKMGMDEPSVLVKVESEQDEKHMEADGPPTTRKAPADRITNLFGLPFETESELYVADSDLYSQHQQPPISAFDAQSASSCSPANTAGDKHGNLAFTADLPLPTPSGKAHADFSFGSERTDNAAGTLGLSSSMNFTFHAQSIDYEDMFAQGSRPSSSTASSSSASIPSTSMSS